MEIRNEKAVLSILTPCDPARSQFLPEAAESVEALRELFPLEWIVVFDGEAPSGAAGEFGDITISHGDRRGVSAARNTALAVASGRFIIPLDADDKLVSHGVVEALGFFETDEELGWIAPNRVDLETKLPTKHWHEERPWAVGELSTRSREKALAFHPNSMIVRRELAEKLGGWNRIYSFGEDMLFALECGEQARGLSTAAILTEYRTWAGQTVATPAYSSGYESRSTGILNHLNGLRESLGRPPV